MEKANGRCEVLGDVLLVIYVKKSCVERHRESYHPISSEPKYHMDSTFFRVPEKCEFCKTVQIDAKVFDRTAESANGETEENT